MTSLAWLIPAALTLGMMGLAAFLWALRSGQFDDLEGAKWRAISDDNDRMATTSERSPADDV
jgi:cbb3-type cytochrome oxidase maturation protein